MGVLLLAALACVPPGDDASKEREETGDSGAALRVCPEVSPPALSTETWTLTGAVPATGLHTLAADGGAPVWLGSHSIGVWKGDDALQWEAVVLGITHTIAEIALSPDDPDVAFRSAGGHLERTTDGGSTWDSLPLGLVDGVSMPDEVWAVAVTPWAPERVLAVQESGAASISFDAGDSFVTAGYPPIHEPPLVDDPFHTWGWRLIPEVAEGGRVVFGDGFGVSTSDDAMGTWTRRLDTPLGGYSLLRDPLDDTHLVVGGPDGLYVSTDAGDTWTLHDIGGAVLVGAWARDGSWLALLGAGTLYTSTDAGETFTASTVGLDDPTAALILDDGRLIVATQRGISVTTDRGATWADVSEGLEDRGLSVVAPDPACPARVYTGSRCGGGLFRSDDYGETWASIGHYFHYLMALRWDPTVAGRVWAVSDDKLLRSDDDGESWSEVLRRYHFHGFTTHPDDPDLLLLGSVGSGEWADATMRVYRSEDGGLNWEDTTFGLPVTDASAHALLRWPGQPEIVLLGTYKAGDVSHRTGQGIGLWRSVDGASRWARVAPEVTDIAALAEAGEAVWAATDQGLWWSVDAGESWAAAEGPTGQVLSVTFQGEVGIALDAAGALWKTADAGATWVEHDEALARNPSTSLAEVAISADGAVGYVTVFDEGVWRIGL